MSSSGVGPSGVKQAGSGSSGGGSARKRWNQGPSGQSFWDSPDPSPEVVLQLAEKYPELVVVPEEVLGGVAAGWGKLGVVVRSLGRRLATETITRELRSRAGIKGEVQGAYLDNGVSLLRLPSAADRSLLLEKPWLVAGQALAIEAWWPSFFPVAGAISSATVWVRLPHLPAEFWSPEALRVILRPAGTFLSFDEGSMGRNRMGYARVSIRLSLSTPIRPGVQIQGAEGPFWQRFIYEGLTGVCLTCGCFHGEDCPRVATSGEGAASGVEQTEEKETSEDSSASPAHQPLLGPCLLAVHRWRPSETATPPHRPGKEPVEVHSSEGWMVPAKLARHSIGRREAVKAGTETTALSVTGGCFSPLTDMEGTVTRQPASGKKPRGGLSRAGENVQQEGSGKASSQVVLGRPLPLDGQSVTAHFNPPSKQQLGGGARPY